MESIRALHNEATADFAICERKSVMMLQADYNKSLLLIQQLKADKKKLKEALRKVISERNSKTEKLQELREKYKKLESFLKKEADFIKDFRQDCLEFQRNKQSQSSKGPVLSKYKKDIEKLFDSVRNSIKSHGIVLTYDKSLDNLISKSIKLEKWEEVCLYLLNLSYKSSKRLSDYSEQDTPQFIKASPDDKIDRFIENSKNLLESLTEQQDKLEKLSKDYQGSLKTPKHTKTISEIPTSVRLITHAESTRNLKSSLGDTPSSVNSTNNSRKQIPSALKFKPKEKDIS